jgi:hypothetical protein
MIRFNILIQPLKPQELPTRKRKQARADLLKWNEAHINPSSLSEQTKTHLAFRQLSLRPLERLDPLTWQISIPKKRYQIDPDDDTIFVITLTNSEGGPIQEFPEREEVRYQVSTPTRRAYIGYSWRGG